MARRYATILLLATLAAATLATGVAAQADDAPHLAPDVATLYAHGTGSDEFNGFMNALEADGDDDALGSGNLVDSEVTWTLTLAPGLAGTVELDPEGTIDITAYIGASQGVGRVTVTTEILHGETVVASGDGETHTITPANAESDGLYGEVTWSLAPETTTLAPGQDLVWTVTAEGTASNIFMGIGEGRGRSNMVLPVLSVSLDATGDAIHEDLTNATVDLEFSHEEPTNATYSYNWTNSEAAVDVSIDGVVEAGSVLYEVADAEGAVVVASIFDNATGPETTSVAAAAQGNWSISVEFANFTGTFSMRIGPPVLGVGANGTAPGPGDADNETGGPLAGNQTGEDGGGIPSAGTAATLAAAALGVAVAASRRRRR